MPRCSSTSGTLRHAAAASNLSSRSLRPSRTTGPASAFDSKLTNGRVEAANSLIQAAKAKPRGYATIRHLITIAYLVAGKLTHLPASPFNLKACALRAP